MGRPFTGGTSPAAIAVQHDRVIEAIRMRKDGFSLREIAAELGWNSVQAASKAMRELIDRTTYETVDELRQVVGERYDALIKQYLPLAIGGDTDAAHVVLKTEAQRAKLFGLDAPIRAEISGPDGGPVEVVEVDDLVHRILAYPSIGRLVAGEPDGDDATGTTGDQA